MENKQYMTIRKAAKELGIPVDHIRREVKNGNCPGFFSGTSSRAWFHVDVPAFREVLSRSNIRADAQ